MIMKVFAIEWVNSNKEQSRAKFYKVPLITNFKNNSISKFRAAKYTISNLAVMRKFTFILKMVKTEKGLRLDRYGFNLVIDEGSSSIPLNF